jgi:hypothetical protein
MRIRNYCSVCHETFDAMACPQCYSTEFVTVYVCDVCKKSYYWRQSEKNCCDKVKELSKKGGKE